MSSDLALPVAGRAIEWTTVVGTIATLVAIGIASIPGPVRARRGAARS